MSAKGLRDIYLVVDLVSQSGFSQSVRLYQSVKPVSQSVKVKQSVKLLYLIVIQF